MLTAKKGVIYHTYVYSKTITITKVKTVQNMSFTTNSCHVKTE